MFASFILEQCLLVWSSMPWYWSIFIAKIIQFQRKLKERLNKNINRKCHLSSANKKRYSRWWKYNNIIMKIKNNKGRSIKKYKSKSEIVGHPYQLSIYFKTNEIKNKFIFLSKAKVSANGRWIKNSIQRSIILRYWTIHEYINNRRN